VAGVLYVLLNMKHLPYIFGLLLTCSLLADSYKTAEILPDKFNSKDTPAITMEYVYNGNTYLYIRLQNIEVNAAAIGINAKIKIDNSTITITPVEEYPAAGPVDSVKSVAIQYIIKDVEHREYTVIHDDTATEGQDRVVKALLDLTSSPKGLSRIEFYEPNGEDPFK
jgi:hypothetical protein